MSAPLASPVRPPALRSIQRATWLAAAALVASLALFAG